MLVRSPPGHQKDATTTAAPEHGCEPTAPVADIVDPLTSGFGRIDLQGHESSYVESDHWSAILDEISDIKDMVKNYADTSYETNHEQVRNLPGVDLFLLQTPPTTQLDILAAVPPRPIVDSILAKYFSSADMPVTLVIHRRVFFKQYENFWDDPFGTPVIWLTTLFEMMFIVAYYTLHIDKSLEPLDEGTLLQYKNIIAISREKMIQCLRLGNYMKGTPHTIEALLSLLQIEYVQGEDTQQGCWQLIGVIIRVALKMGYHRDGSHFPEMSVFEAEMRRRTWYILMQFDIASASQVGLPRIIKQAQCDTAEPRNLLDDDFDETTTTLSPGRPPNEHTLSQFLIYKSRIISVYGMICDFTTSSKQKDYAGAIHLDSMLNNAYTRKPPILDLKPMHRSILDGANLITRRLYIAMSYHHAQMTLHRKFMIVAKTNSAYTYSHTTCLGAALAVMQHQTELFEQCQPGRMLYTDRWKVLSLIQSEFLLATTILCFNLDDDLKHQRWKASPLSSNRVYKDSITALQTSQAIWRQRQGMSKEAQTAVKAIDVVLDRARNTAVPFTSHATSQYVFGSSVLSTSSMPTNLLAADDAQRKDSVASTASNSHSDISIEQFPATPSSTASAAADDCSAGVLPGLQADVNDGVWNEFFDMDQSWETWLQF
ncbi:hypothetical protein N0V94_003774 [Neodidymelliopsis sp. IMI 364377]|nr:hypothetical protein N0V94_003774 [Neodidymelliopsis sp. IMI 364377]